MKHNQELEDRTKISIAMVRSALDRMEENLKNNNYVGIEIQADMVIVVAESILKDHHEEFQLQVFGKERTV